MAVVYVASGLTAATLSVGFGLWMLLGLIESNRAPVTYSPPNKKASQMATKANESEQFPKTATMTPIRISIEQDVE